MQLAIGTLESLITATNAVIEAPKNDKVLPSKVWRKLDRILRRHDRKGELRAQILAISPEEFRKLQKRQGFEQTVRQSGFKDMLGFAKALLGKLKQELHGRGWSPKKINHLINTRSRHFARAF